MSRGAAAAAELRHSPCDPLSLSRRALPALKVATVRAGTATVSPVRGFPSLARRTVGAAALDNAERAAMRAQSSVRFTTSLRYALGRRCSMMSAVFSRGRAGVAAPGVLSGIGFPNGRSAGPHFCAGPAGPAMVGGRCACGRHAIFAVAARGAESGG